MNHLKPKLIALLLAGAAASPAFAAYEYHIPVQKMVVQAETCTTPWGSVLTNGQQTVGFAAESVAYGSTCAEITVSCDKGVLNAGAARFGSCSVQSPVFDNTWNAATKGQYNTVISPLVIETTGDGANWNASVTVYGTGSYAHAMSTKTHASGKWYFELASTGNGFLRGGLASAYGAPLYGYLSPVSSTSAELSYAVDLDNGVVTTYSKTCQVLAVKTGVPVGVPYYAVMEAGGGGWTPRQFITANFGASTFRCPVPAGYQAGF